MDGGVAVSTRCSLQHDAVPVQYNAQILLQGGLTSHPDPHSSQASSGSRGWRTMEVRTTRPVSRAVILFTVREAIRQSHEPKACQWPNCRNFQLCNFATLCHFFRGMVLCSPAVGARRAERYVTATSWRARVSAGPHRACALALAVNSGARPGGSPRRAWNWPLRPTRQPGRLPRSALAEHGMLRTFGDSGA